jgi:hypothetical protein
MESTEAEKLKVEVNDEPAGAITVTAPSKPSTDQLWQEWGQPVSEFCQNCQIM